jgi:uncharacterized DUF497 family protein
MSLEFEWDEKKAALNKKKHGVTFEEAAAVFGDPLAAVFDDEAHSDDERREIIVGHSEKKRLLVVSYAERGDRIRIISARRATKLERQNHEENPRR